MFDVTLATEDSQQLQAHKLILSAGSNFFSNIFLNSNHHNLLIYLKGISSTELNHIIDFIYNGKAVISQEDLNKFLEIGKELQLKGLDDDLQGLEKNVFNDKQKIWKDNDGVDDIKREITNMETIQQGNILDSSKGDLIDTDILEKDKEIIKDQDSLSELNKYSSGGITVGFDIVVPRTICSYRFKWS